MNPYVVFLLYLVAILGFVAITLLMNRVLGPKPVAFGDQARAVRMRRHAGRARCNVKAVPIKYYARRDRLHPVRPRDRVPLHPGRWARSRSPASCCSRSCCSSFLLVLLLLYVYKARLLEAVTQ